MVKQVKPKVRKETEEVARTFQTRFGNDFPDLDDLSRRYNSGKRTLYHRASQEKKPFDNYKIWICEEFGLPSRLFNALKTDLDGMVLSIQEKAKFDASDIEDKLERCTKLVASLTRKLEKPDISDKVRASAQKDLARQQQLQQRLTSRLGRVQALTTNKFPSICFGARKLVTAQNHLAANGFVSQEEWRLAWRERRQDQFLVVGSNDESDGNKTCRSYVNKDGTVTLDLFTGGKNHVVFSNVRLSHGHKDWIQAILAAQAEYLISLKWQKQTAKLVADCEKNGGDVKALRSERLKLRKAQPKTGYAITYRFLKDSLGWRVFITVTKTVPLLKPDFANGSIGLDLNDQHVSRTMVGPTGEFVNSLDLPMVTVGKTSGQRLARLHDLANELVKEASCRSVPLVIETLDFGLKKRRLKDVGCEKAARRFSAFCYARFAAILKSHARLHGVCVVEVNPAYTSILGAALFAVPNGLTVHGGAAMAIARRAMGVEEKLPQRMQVWMPGRAPISIERPVSLRRCKVSVHSQWREWKEVTSAVLEARKKEWVKPPTGAQRRRLARDAHAATVPW